MSTLCDKSGVTLEEILGHTGNLVTAIDGALHEEYFYIELPISGSFDTKRRYPIFLR